MTKTNLITSTYGVLKRLPMLITITALASQTLLTGCASMNQKEESVEEILAKENVLITKVKAERAQAEVQQGVSQSESLKKAELHLDLALDEMLKANDVMTNRILRDKNQEVMIER